MRNKLLFLLVFLSSPGAALAILPIQHWQTGDGARVYFVENRDIPMLDVSVDFMAGSAFDAADKQGVASMTNRLLQKGAQGMDEDAIARRTADVGASIGGRFDNDRAGLAMRTLSARAEREQAFEVFLRVLHQPLFPEDVLEREKRRLLSALKEADIQPGTIASRTFQRMVYGAHPYGQRASGELDSVPRITRDDLSAFHRTHYAARGAVIAIMGDVTRAEAEALATRIAAGLPAGAGARPVIAPVANAGAGGASFIPHHATQSHIFVGAVGIARSDPDYFALFVGNHILGGGGFASRISDEVRQKRGLAYSAYSYFSPLAQAGPFAIGMQTRKDQAKEALSVTMKTLRDFIADGPTAAELADAKKNLIGGFPLRIDSNRKIHEYLAVIGFYQLPLNYLDDFVPKIERVTVADIKRAFAARIDPDKLTTVVVGADDTR
jgi:zinc protease